MQHDANPSWAVGRAIRDGDRDALDRLFREHPPLADRVDDILGSWLFTAAGTPHTHIAEYLVRRGMSVNLCVGVERQTPLQIAVDFNQLEMTEFLLSKGADPNVGRPLIGAINREPEPRALAFVRLLVEHGADVNRRYDLYGNKDRQFTALDWASSKPNICEFLRTHGAKTLSELKQGGASSDDPLRSETPAGSLLECCERHFGQVKPRSLIEVVPSDVPITIHAAESPACITLFTEGMSSSAMKVAKGEEAFAFAELFIQLPCQWPYQDLANPEHGWPIHWLRRLAKLPHRRGTGLGGAATVIENDASPAELAPNVKFTAMLLLAEKECEPPDGRYVRLYRLIPLHPAESEFARRHGIPMLMRLFDARDVPWVFDPLRPDTTAEP